MLIQELEIYIKVIEEERSHSLTRLANYPIVPLKYFLSL